MAEINYYGRIDDYYINEPETYTPIINLLCGFTMFAIKEVTIEEDGFEIIAYEKSFWGSKKKKGHLKVQYFNKTGFELNSGWFKGQTVSEFVNTLMAFEFWSEYERVSDQDFISFYLGKPRKEIVSYAVANIFLKIRESSYENSMLNSVSEVSLDNPSLSNDFHNASGHLKYLREVRKLLKLTKADLEK